MSTADKRTLFLVDPSATFHSIDPEKSEFHWSAKTRGCPAFKLLNDRDQKEVLFGFPAQEIAADEVCETDHKHLWRYNQDKQPEECLNVDSVESLRTIVPEEYEVNGNKHSFWIHLQNGVTYENRSTCPSDQQQNLVHIVRRNFQLSNTRLNLDLSYSTFEALKDEETSEDARVRILHIRTFEGLHNLLGHFRIPLCKVLLEELIVYHDTRRKMANGKLMFSGRLHAFSDKNFEPKLVMVEKTPTLDPFRLMSLSTHLGSHDNLLKCYGKYPFQEEEYYAFETFDRDLTSMELVDADKLVSSILSGAMYFYNRKCIHGNLCATSVVVSEKGEFKLFASSSRGPLDLDKEDVTSELRDLGKLLEYSIRKYVIGGFLKYQDLNPVVCDLIARLKNNSITIQQLILHHINWAFDKKMKFLYDVTMCLDDNQRPDAISLESALSAKDIQDRVFLHTDKGLHMIFMEYMEISAKFKKYGIRCLSALLRVIRNCYHHEGKVEGSVRLLYGKSVQGLEAYLSGIFPRLCMVVYDMVQLYCVQEGHFKDYVC